MNNKISLIAFLALVLGGTWFVWTWGFCRFYVDPDEMAIVTSKTGDPLPPGQFLAKSGQKGILEDVLGEGRHFLNPVIYDHEIVRVTIIPPGKVGIVTSKVGQDLPSGRFLADRGEKGIWRGVLGPGKYRLNPYGYNVDIVDAISIPIGYAGVMTSLAGNQAPEGEFAGPNQKGVRRDILQPGLYYINPKEVKCDVVEIGVNQVSLLGKGGGAVITKTQIASQNVAMDELQKNVLREQKEKRWDYLKDRQAGSASESEMQAAAPQMAMERENFIASGKVSAFGLALFVEFPSRDGFEISLDMTVEFELLPERIASVYRNYGDLPAVVDKIIMPQILSVSRLKGSAYRAKDYIVGEGREKFQTDLTEALKKILEEKDIIVHNALIRHVNVPMQILDPIQQASIAVEQDLTNKEKQNTAKRQAQLNTELSLIEQRREQVAQETEKIKGEMRANQDKEVAEIKANAQKFVAEIENQAALVRAEKTRKIGEARAKVITLVEGERANGFNLKAQAFGDSTAFALWEFANNLNPDVRINILHAGEGTLWTDLEKATLGELGGAAILKK